MALQTISETFFQLYYCQGDCDNDVVRYHKAVENFEEHYRIKAPYKNYQSFKTAISNWYYKNQGK